MEHGHERVLTELWSIAIIVIAVFLFLFMVFSWVVAIALSVAVSPLFLLLILLWPADVLALNAILKYANRLARKTN